MILEITTVLFLIHGLGMLSRLLARRRDVFYYVSRPVHGPHRVSYEAHAAKAQYPAASL
jgi:hypothetical protein